MLARDGQHLSRHVAREIAREEHYRISDLPGLGGAAKGLAPAQIREQLGRGDRSRNACMAMLGATALMRTPCAAASIAEQRVKAMTPAFAAA